MLSIIVPTYNEKENLPLLLAQIDSAIKTATPYEVVVVDDSTDDTPILLASLAKTNENLRYLHREGKSGLASAVVCGFEMAKGDVLAVMDADLQHPPALLPRMYAIIEQGTDVVLPSRYIGGGGSEGLSPIRLLASKSAKMAGGLLLKSMRNISDPMSGFFMFRRAVIDGVTLRPTGWKILMEVLTMGNYSSVVEIPYAFDKRHAGESKLSLKVTIQYFLHILSLIFRSERERRFYLFALIGVSGMTVDMLLFSLISRHASLQLNIRLTITAYVAMMSNYVLNRTFTWRSTRSQKVLPEFLRYVAVCSLGIGIKNIAASLLSLAGVPDILCNLFGILIACLSNYFLSDRLVFNAKKSEITYTVLDKQDSVLSAGGK